MKNGIEYLNRWNLAEPDQIGSSEYRSLYELLSDALTGCEQDRDTTPEAVAYFILDEVIGWANEIKKHIPARP